MYRKKESPQNDKLFNCRQKNCCLLDGKCLTKCVVYKATVTETNSKKQETYIGLTENEFKTKFNLQKSLFKLEHKRTTTTLSEHIWRKTDKGSDHLLEKANFDEFSNCIHIQVLYIKF